MENLSILSLFNNSLKVELPKQAPVNQGEFENVFKKYLERAENNAPKQADTAQKTEKESVQAEEPKTPEEVIDNLNISEDKKAELKRMMSKIESEEDAKELLAEMALAIQEAGGSENQLDMALTDLAKTLLSSETDDFAGRSVLLESTLDEIVASQNFAKQQNPQLTAIKGGNGEASQQQQQKNSEEVIRVVQNATEELPEELQKKIMEAVSDKRAGVKDVKVDFASELHAKTEPTEKVIKAEIKIESPRDIMKFAEIVELAKTQKANKINLQLHPQELGKVNIELVEQAGKVSGKVTFESETARNLFANNIEGLRQQLAEKGVIVESLEFLFQDLEHHEFAGWEGKEGNKGGKSGEGVGDELNSDEENEDSPQRNDNIYA
jgi:flagellar hook-length control protein FliK